MNFFSSWCEPCQKETPLLARFYRAEHAKVAIVGLDENDVLGSAMSFTHKEGVGYPVGFDPEVVAASAYGVAALPQTFFLDARHRIVDRVFGAVTQADSTAASRSRREARNPTSATCWSWRPPRSGRRPGRRATARSVPRQGRRRR